jgi:hypothetical protein
LQKKPFDAAPFAGNIFSLGKKGFLVRQFGIACEKKKTASRVLLPCLLLL